MSSSACSSLTPGSLTQLTCLWVTPVYYHCSRSNVLVHRGSVHQLQYAVVPVLCVTQSPFPQNVESYRGSDLQLLEGVHVCAIGSEAERFCCRSVGSSAHSEYFCAPGVATAPVWCCMRAAPAERFTSWSSSRGACELGL